MSVFIADGPLGICDRCQRKMLMRELSPDRDSPALMVCHECNDLRDPWRSAWVAKDADIVVDRARPERELDVPSTMTTVDANGVVKEGAIPADLTVKPSSQ